MKDNGTVVSTQEGFARVRVDCLDACAGCPAHSICLKNSPSKAVLSVRNPLRACPGDTVQIEIREGNYSRALIHLFGVLLAGCLAGLGAGYLISIWTSLGPSLSGASGVVSGLLLAGSWIYRFFRRTDRESLYPVITAITQKGECHG